MLPVTAQMSLIHYPLPVFPVPFVAVSAVIVFPEGMSQPAVVPSVPVVAVVEIKIVVESQVAVVVVDTPSAQADKSCPGDPYKVGSPDIAAEDIRGNHKGPVTHQYEVNTAPGMTEIVDGAFAAVKVIGRFIEPVLIIRVRIIIIVIIIIIAGILIFIVPVVLAQCDAGEQYH